MATWTRGSLAKNCESFALAIIYANRGEDKKFLRELEAYVELTPNAPDVEKLKTGSLS